MRLTTLTMLLTISGTSNAQHPQLYRWVDAAGNAHYSSTPPPRGTRFTTQPVPRTAAAAMPTTTATANAAMAKAGGEHPQCTAARSNLATLSDTSRQVMMDSDRDGKPDRALAPGERESQLELARAFLAANCGGR